MRFHSIILAAVSLVFAGLFSQAPEFSQQYYQRIGGAIDELQRGRQQFDENARRLTACAVGLSVLRYLRNFVKKPPVGRFAVFIKR